jgi:hypothetical protein
MPRNHIPKVVSDFEAAVRAMAFKGAQPPADHAAIEADYEEALQALLKKLGKRTPRQLENRINKFSDELYSFLGQGGGDGETIHAAAIKLAKL